MNVFENEVTDSLPSGENMVVLVSYLLACIVELNSYSYKDDNF